MNVLFVLPDLRQASGISVFAVETARILQAQGIRVTLAFVASDCGNRYPAEGLEVLSAESALPRIRSRVWDLVHIHGLWTPLFHQVCTAARTAGVPYVFSPHGMLQKWALKNKRWKKLLGLMLYQWNDLRNASLLHATATTEVDDIRCLRLPNKVVVAPLGVNLPKLKVTDDGERRMEKVLLFVSRVQRKKGLPNLIEAWAKLPQELTNNWHVRIVGPDEENHSAELKALCDRLHLAYQDSTRQCPPLPSTIITFVGPKYGEGLAAEYDNADLFVLPTHSENFGSVVIEALAHRVPVICSKGAPWQELETHGCGWWVDNAPESLADTLREAMAKDLSRMGEHGRQWMERDYSWQSVGEKMKAAYEWLIDPEHVQRPAWERM